MSDEYFYKNTESGCKFSSRKCFKMSFGNFTWACGCNILSETVNTRKVKHRNKALVETAIRVSRVGEKWTPLGLHRTCCGLECGLECGKREKERKRTGSEM